MVMRGICEAESTEVDAIRLSYSPAAEMCHNTYSMVALWRGFLDSGFDK